MKRTITNDAKNDEISLDIDVPEIHLGIFLGALLFRIVVA